MLVLYVALDTVTVVLREVWNVLGDGITHDHNHASAQSSCVLEMQFIVAEKRGRENQQLLIKWHRVMICYLFALRPNRSYIRL